jgi:S1-C subfamily serine protease
MDHHHRKAAPYPWPLFAALAVIGFAQAGGAERSATPTRAIADATLASTVGIRCEGADAFINHSGTGIVVSPGGHILTATSVVPPGARKIRVTFPGFVVRDATIVAVDEKLAVALIKVDTEGSLPFLPLARDLPAVGTTAYTAADVENALLTNGRASFSRGIVSGIYDIPKHPEAAYAGTAIETTAAVNPGSDGGPLVDEAGRVCGVITLGTLPLRWQGTAVPTAVLVERFAPFTAGGILPPAGAAVASASHPLQTVAAEVAASLVAVEVERQFPAEALPRMSWEEFRAGIKDFDKLGAPQRMQRFNDYLNIARAFEVNQLLRRPATAVTGLVVSADGFVLTSLFNVGGDMAFIRKATGKPRSFDVHEPIQKLLGDPDGGVEQRPNAIKKVTVALRDGTRHEAQVVSRHEPLGVALLKIEAADLPWYDVTGNSVSPQLGDAVGLVGHLPGEQPGFTLNAGIVSAPARNRGYQFQTDALLNYGNSGGPLVDRAGNFLGLAAAPIQPDTLLGRLVSPQQLMMWTRAPNSGVGMAARADRIRDVLEAMKGGKSFDRIPGPLLGVQADESKAFGDAVVVGGVGPGTPAEKAGIKRGDIVLEMDGEELRSWPELTERISACKPGQTVELKVQRRGQGARLVIAGRDVETAEDLQRLKKSLKPGETFEGVLSTDDTRVVQVTLGENR